MNKVKAKRITYLSIQRFLDLRLTLSKVLSLMAFDIRNPEFPREILVPLESHPHLLGRLTLNLVHDGVTVEVEIVQKEGRKIWAMVDRIYGIDSDHEAMDLAVQKLSDYLARKSP